jgi:hypothetical protein
MFILFFVFCILIPILSFIMTILPTVIQFVQLRKLRSTEVISFHFYPHKLLLIKICAESYPCW